MSWLMAYFLTHPLQRACEDNTICRAKSCSAKWHRNKSKWWEGKRFRFLGVLEEDSSVLTSNTYSRVAWSISEFLLNSAIPSRRGHDQLWLFPLRTPVWTHGRVPYRCSAVWRGLGPVEPIYGISLGLGGPDQVLQRKLRKPQSSLGFGETPSSFPRESRLVATENSFMKTSAE